MLVWLGPINELISRRRPAGGSTDMLQHPPNAIPESLRTPINSLAGTMNRKERSLTDAQHEPSRPLEEENGVLVAQRSGGDSSGFPSYRKSRRSFRVHRNVSMSPESSGRRPPDASAIVLRSR